MAELKKIEGGFHVKEVPGGGCVDVLKMLVNWRVVRTVGFTGDGDHAEYDRAWCYFGTGQDTLYRAVAAAMEWDGGDDTEPKGYGKRAI